MYIYIYIHTYLLIYILHRYRYTYAHMFLVAEIVCFLEEDSPEVKRTLARPSLAGRPRPRLALRAVRGSWVAPFCSCPRGLQRKGLAIAFSRHKMQKTYVLGFGCWLESRSKGARSDFCVDAHRPSLRRVVRPRASWARKCSSYFCFDLGDLGI